MTTPQKMRLALPFVLLFLLVGTTIGAEGDGERPRLKRMPWHLIDLWWTLEGETEFESLEMDVEIKHDVPEDVRLYISPIGIAHLNGTPFYGGLQTQSDGNTKADHRLRGIGRGLLMSMWGERELEAIRPSAGGLLQSSGHEGDFVSVRRPYEWTKGRYTYRVVKMDAEGEKTWVGAFLYAHATNENLFIGALRFPGSDLQLAPRVANFVEIYGRAIPVEKIPRVDVLFGPVRINGKSAMPIKIDARYPKGVPDVAAASSIEEGQRVLVEVGVDWIDRPTREEALYERAASE